jgi:hypothetical protein
MAPPGYDVCNQMHQASHHQATVPERTRAGSPALDGFQQAALSPIHERTGIHSIYARALEDSTNFRATYDPLRSSAEEIQDEHSTWAATPVGATVLHCVADTLMDRLVQSANPGPIAHDFRHMGIKDPISALRICVDLNLSEASQSFLIASLAHDLGRLVEHHLIDTTHADIPTATHGILSFHYLREILAAAPTMPKTLKDDLLYAVLVHSDHRALLNFTLQAVQQADRAHMIGPEGIIRCLCYDVGLCKLPLFDGTIDSSSLLSNPNATPDTFSSTLLYFCQQLPAPTLGNAGEHFIEQRASTLKFLALLTDQSPIAEQRILSGAALRSAIRSSLQQLLTIEHSPDPLTVYVSQPNAAVVSLLSSLEQTLSELSEPTQHAFLRAFSFLVEERARFDRIDAEELTRALHFFQGTGTLAERLARFVSLATAGRYQ